jgi:hypothetical protein
VYILRNVAVEEMGSISSLVLERTSTSVQKLCRFLRKDTQF